jgi:hypothetical protein
VHQVDLVAAQQVDQLPLRAGRREDQAVAEGEGLQGDGLVVVRLAPGVMEEDDLDAALPEPGGDLP